MISNIYEGQTILLDIKNSFSLKLSYDQDYIIEDHASLIIDIDSWTK